MEAHGRAAPVIDWSKIDQRGLGYAAAITLAPQPSAARYLDLEPIGESVDDADADAVQAAGGPVCITTELAPGVQGRQDDLEGGFVGKTRMRIDRDTPAVVADCDPVLNRKLDFDTGSMPGDGLVHGVVENLGDEVMQAALIGSADIHAGAAANRFQPFEYLYVFRGIVRFGLRGRRIEKVGHGANITSAKVSSSRILYVTRIDGTRYWRDLNINRTKWLSCRNFCEPWCFRGMMTPMMMTNERKIWEAALLLVRRHGAAAAEIAQREAQRLRSSDDELTCVVWCWIARSTAELLRPVPDKGERIH
jgi:hypothetical protein